MENKDQKEKELFQLCEQLYNHIHVGVEIIDNSVFDSDYMVFTNEGYKFNSYVNFDDGTYFYLTYPDFKQYTIDEAISLLKSLK